MADIRTESNGRLVEALSEAVHEGWMAEKLAQGIRSRKTEWGEELMKPYGELSEAARELDRATVRAVTDAIVRAGYRIVKLPPPRRPFRDGGDDD